MTGTQALAAIIDNLSQPETCTCGPITSTARDMEGRLREAHEVVPAQGDFFALSTTCQLPSCGRRALWRIGTGEWEHVDTNHA